MPEPRHPLLGHVISRKFKIYREEFPAIFRFEGVLYQEEFDIDQNRHIWVEIKPEDAERWLNALSPRSA